MKNALTAASKSSTGTPTYNKELWEGDAGQQRRKLARMLPQGELNQYLYQSTVRHYKRNKMSVSMQVLRVTAKRVQLASTNIPLPYFCYTVVVSNYTQMLGIR